MSMWSGSIPKRHLCIPFFIRYPARKFHRDRSTVLQSVCVSCWHRHCKYCVSSSTLHNTSALSHSSKYHTLHRINHLHKTTTICPYKRMSARHFQIRSSNFQGFNDWRTNDLSECVIKHCQPLRRWELALTSVGMATKHKNNSEKTSNKIQWKQTVPSGKKNTHTNRLKINRYCNCNWGTQYGVQQFW